MWDTICRERERDDEISQREFLLNLLWIVCTECTEIVASLIASAVI